MKTDKKWKRIKMQEAALDILLGNEALSLRTLTERMQGTVKPIRGVYKITPLMVAASLRGVPRIHKFTNEVGLSMYYAD